jgi:hypothetical protein
MPPYDAAAVKERLGSIAAANIHRASPTR